MSILMNGSLSEEFRVERGIRQGDPLAPFLFILAPKRLNAIVNEAVEKGIFRGVRDGSDQVMVSYLQYADDTIFFGEWNTENARALMTILRCFEEVPGLWVNFNKSKLYGLGVSDKELGNMANGMRCDIGEFPFTYLGLPVRENMSRVNAWKPIVDKFKNRLADWKAKTMSFGGRLTLGMWGFWWSFGRGWGVTGRGKGWHDIVKCGVKIEGLGLEFTSSCLGILGDGRDIRFWEDRWVDNRKFRDRFPRLFHLDRSKEGSVMDKGTWDWSRNISGKVCREFDDLIEILLNVVVSSTCRDRWRWAFDVEGGFKVKTLTGLIEEKILQVEVGGQDTLWNKLVSKKVNIFVWRARKGRLPVRVELDKRGIDLDSVLCASCNDSVETCTHCLVTCELAMSVWTKQFNWWKVGNGNAFTIYLIGGRCGMERNARVLGNKVSSGNKILQDIQLKSYEWIVRRSKKYKAIDWQQWLRDPPNILI
ncbi:reverse transcriptase domain, reverse transcriptase zinc-binding domain protein [Tanacetum coccineum]